MINRKVKDKKYKKKRVSWTIWSKCCQKSKGNFNQNKRERCLQKRWWYCGRKAPDIKNCGRKEDEKKN